MSLQDTDEIWNEFKDSLKIFNNIYWDEPEKTERRIKTYGMLSPSVYIEVTFENSRPQKMRLQMHKKLDVPPFSKSTYSSAHQIWGITQPKEQVTKFIYEYIECNKDFLEEHCYLPFILATDKSEEVERYLPDWHYSSVAGDHRVTKKTERVDIMIIFDFTDQELSFQICPLDEDFKKRIGNIIYSNILPLDDDRFFQEAINPLSKIYRDTIITAYEGIHKLYEEGVIE